MKQFAFVLLILMSLSACNTDQHKYAVSVIPEPNQMTINPGRYVYSGEPNVSFQSNDKLEHEQYTLEVSNNKVVIGHSSEAGKRYALATLAQLKSRDENETYVPHVTINDKPRFAYRGFMLDEARHFQGIDFVKKTLDRMAFHKLNKFHWHLSDDQGWRIEIQKYPLLTEIGSKRKGTQVGWKSDMMNCPIDSVEYGSFYTQNQIREVIDYAAQLGIDVIPEIDMPGHMMAALTAYPHLGENKKYEVRTHWGVSDDVLDVSNPQTLQFAKDIIAEICDLFPYQMVHIGGDECPKGQWKKSKACQKLIKDLNLKDEEELQSWFLKEIEKVIHAKGKIMGGWDEILDGNMSETATVYHWRFWTKDDMTVKGARRGNNVVSTLNHRMYFDHYVSEDKERFEPLSFPAVTPMNKIYNFNPIPAELEPQYHHKVIGVQGNLWTEYVQTNQVAELRMFPRLAVLSEVAWTNQELRNWENMNRKLPRMFEIYDQWNIHYNRVYLSTGFEK